MDLSAKPILPGSFVVVKDTNSIYRGYKGFVQRVTKKRAAVLFEGGSFSFCNHLIPGFKNLSSKSLRDLTFTCPLIP